MPYSARVLTTLYVSAAIHTPATSPSSVATWLTLYLKGHHLRRAYPADESEKGPAQRHAPRRPRHRHAQGMAPPRNPSPAPAHPHRSARPSRKTPASTPAQSRTSASATSYTRTPPTSPAPPSSPPASPSPRPPAWRAAGALLACWPRSRLRTRSSPVPSTAALPSAPRA